MKRKGKQWWENVLLPWLNCLSLSLPCRCLLRLDHRSDVIAFIPIDHHSDVIAFIPADYHSDVIAFIQVDYRSDVIAFSLIGHFLNVIVYSTHINAMIWLCFSLCHDRTFRCFFKPSFHLSQPYLHQLFQPWFLCYTFSAPKNQR